MYADPVINKIDPHRAVTYRLYRQDTQVGCWGTSVCTLRVAAAPDTSAFVRSLLFAHHHHQQPAETVCASWLTRCPSCAGFTPAKCCMS